MIFAWGNHNFKEAGGQRASVLSPKSALTYQKWQIIEKWKIKTEKSKENNYTILFNNGKHSCLLYLIIII